LFAAAGGCDVPSRVSHSTAPPSSVLPLLALDRHRTLRRIVRMCGRAILSRGSVNTIIHVIVDLPLPSPTCVSAALACCLTCAHVAPTAAMLERKIERLGMKCIVFVKRDLLSRIPTATTPPQVKLTTTPSSVMRLVTWSRIRPGSTFTFLASAASDAAALCSWQPKSHTR
jgi:hypothetical protein